MYKCINNCIRLYKMSIKLNDSKESKVMRLFFDYPMERYHIREIARLTGVHPNSVIDAVKKLERIHLVKSRKKRNVVEVYANAESRDFIFRKRIFNIEKIYSSGLIAEIVKLFNPELISLIGSYSRGEDIERSDVDIVIVCKNEKEVLDLSKYETALSRSIHLIKTGYNKMSDEFYTNLINGIVLYGYIKQKKGEK